MAKSANSCAKHRQAANRKPLDHIMAELPRSQAGKEGEGGRHKCAYCAYERGFEDGLKSAVEKFRTVIMESPNAAKGSVRRF